MSKSPKPRKVLVAQLAVLAETSHKVRNYLGPFLVNATKRDEDLLNSVSAKMIDLEMAITRFGS